MMNNRVLMYKECRQIAQFSQEDAALLLVVSVRQLSDYENGHAKVPDDVVDRMAEQYNAPLLAIWHMKETPLGKKWLPDFFPTQASSDVWMQTRLACNDAKSAEDAILSALSDGELCDTDIEHIDAYIQHNNASVGKMMSAKAYVQKAKNEIMRSVEPATA